MNPFPPERLQTFADVGGNKAFKKKLKLMLSSQKNCAAVCRLMQHFFCSFLAVRGLLTPWGLDGGSCHAVQPGNYWPPSLVTLLYCSVIW